MDGMKDWLFPSTQIGAVIGLRPLSLDLFYRRGLDPWRDSEMPLSEYCRSHDIDGSGFMRELADLPSADPDAHWEELPCYHLIDHLTEEHRTMLHMDIPAIRYLLDMGFPEAEGVQTLFRTLTSTIGEFADRLRIHLRQEEENIFLGMLANEFRLSHRGALEVRIPGEPPFLASRKIEAASALLEEERHFKKIIDLFMEGACHPEAGSPSSKAYLSVGWLMMSLGTKLRAHARLETDVLFPMAARLERGLNSMSTAGAR
jgi:iron-sulfur cluster repair protein YtfE (RIC family)